MTFSRAPGVTLPIGLGIGRLVFRALNAVEAVFAVAVVAALVVGRQSACVTALLTVAVTVLAVPIVGVRPRLTRRSDQVLAGLDAPRSHGHLVYVGLEVLKSLALIAGGALLTIQLTRGPLMESVSLTRLADSAVVLTVVKNVPSE